MCTYGASLGGSESKKSACNAGDLDSTPGLGRSPGGGHGNPLQYSCLENHHEQKSLAGYSPWSRKELDTTQWLSAYALTHTHTHTHSHTHNRSWGGRRIYLKNWLLWLCGQPSLKFTWQAGRQGEIPAGVDVKPKAVCSPHSLFLRGPQSFFFPQGRQLIGWDLPTLWRVICFI